MENINLIFGIAHILTGLLFIGISIPLLKGSVKMNHLYGVRFKKSFESAENWYKINRYGAKQMILAGVAMIIIGLAAFAVPFSEDNPTLLVLFALAPVLVIIPAIWRSYQYARGL